MGTGGLQREDVQLLLQMKVINSELLLYTPQALLHSLIKNLN